MGERESNDAKKKKKKYSPELIQKEDRQPSKA